MSFDDYDVDQVEILVTPSEIIVHAKTNAEQITEDADWVGAQLGQPARCEPILSPSKSTETQK